jgi:hypothetical protein
MQSRFVGYRGDSGRMSETDQASSATTADRFRCVLTRAGEPECTTSARVTIADAVGDSARACPRHAVAALDGIDGARVDWADTRGLNEYERKALELSEEISAKPPLRPEREPEPEL